MKILKAAPGLDLNNVLATQLGTDHSIVEFNPSTPLIEQVRDVDVLLLRDVPVPAEVMAAGPRIKLLQRYGHHVVGVDLAHARAKGIYVARIPSSVGGASRDVAEHAFFLLLAVAKRYRRAAATLLAREVGKPTTTSVTGKTLCLVGVGSTGTELASLASGFGMHLIAIKRTVSPEIQRALGLEFLGDESKLAEALARADFVSIHLPLEPATRNYVDRAFLAKMRRGSFLINIARGPIVDQDALREALESGHLAGAGLDVFRDEPIDPKDPILALDNVIATPHHAGHTLESEQRLAAIVAENIQLVARGAEPKYQLAPDEAE